MSDPISALNGASYQGLVEIADCGPTGMITLRGDLGARAVKSAIKAGAGVDMPKALGVNGTLAGGVAWMSPDEALILCPYDEVETRSDAMQAKLAKAHTLLSNVSDARAVFRLTGAPVREVLAKLCPLDLSPDGLQPGTIRRTRMAQIPAALWLESATQAHVICFRSVAQYTFDLLKTSAHPQSKPDVFEH
ncbi:MAG: sarcosine oxidase subunit gamma [Sedimentitalea sp.]